MRVIAGSARGRRLKTPRGMGTRPTPDRVREALFSSVAADVPGAVVLDLFAGTGALGIEALSRGAAWATFVERDPRVAAVLEDNVATAGVADRSEVLRSEAVAVVRRLPSRRYTMVFCDPPYAEPLPSVLGLVDALHDAGGLAAAATVVIERDRRDPALASLRERRGVLAVQRQRSYGDTVLLYLATGDL